MTPFALTVLDGRESSGTLMCPAALRRDVASPHVHVPLLQTLPQVYVYSVDLWLAKPGARDHSDVWGIHTDPTSRLL